MYEDHRPFAIVTVLTREPGKMRGISSAYDAAKFVLEEWPGVEDGPKLSTAKAILLKCLEGGCSAAVARVAFIEAAREAHIFMETPNRPPPTGGPGPKWGKRKPARRI